MKIEIALERRDQGHASWAVGREEEAMAEDHGRGKE